MIALPTLDRANVTMGRVPALLVLVVWTVVIYYVCHILRAMKTVSAYSVQPQRNPLANATRDGLDPRASPSTFVQDTA